MVKKVYIVMAAKDLDTSSEKKRKKRATRDLRLRRSGTGNGRNLKSIYFPY